MPEVVKVIGREYKGRGAPPKYDEEIKSVLDKKGTALHEKNRNTMIIISDRARDLGYHVKTRTLTTGGWDIFIQSKPFDN